MRKILQNCSAKITKFIHLIKVSMSMSIIILMTSLNAGSNRDDSDDCLFSTSFFHEFISGE